MSHSHKVTKFILFQISCILLSSAVTDRGGVPVYTIEELLTLKQESTSYLQKPFIITDSPSADWTLYENLYDIFDEFDNGLSINTKSRETDCSCFDTHELCQEFTSTFLYENSENTNYDFWSKHEAKSSEYSKYKKCVNSTKSSFSVQEMSDHLYNLNPESFIENEQSDSLSKAYTYFKLVGLHSNPSSIGMSTLNVLDQISLTPFFDVLDYKQEGYNKVGEIHIWFGTQYYRAVRHFDKSDNLFFVLSGSRHFRLSPPSMAVYDLHPFKHASGRQQYPVYPVMSAVKNKNNGTNGGRSNTCFMDNDGLAANTERYQIMEADVFEGEALFFPGYWYHEVINQNYSCALNVWFEAPTFPISDKIADMQLVLNPEKTPMAMDEVDEFFYFIQVWTEKWCDTVSSHSEIAKDPLVFSKCDGGNNGGFRFMSTHFARVYPVLMDLSYDTFEWMDLGLGISNILKCTNDRVGYSYFDCEHKSIRDWKNENFVCYSIQEKFVKKWDLFVETMIYEHLEFGNVGVIEANMLDYLENVLYQVSGSETTVIPLWISMMML